MQIDKGIADVGPIAYIAPVAPEAAANLGATFDEMAGDAGGTQAMPVVPFPAELVHCRADGERRIRDAARDHDFGALRKRVCDRFRAEIRIGADDARAN